MDNFGDVFGGIGDVIGELFGGDAGGEGGLGLGAFFAPDGRAPRGDAVPIVYARYLCGGPRELNINDR